MDINGPMRIGVLQTDGVAGWELHFDFREEFQALDLPQQLSEQLLEHIASGDLALNETIKVQVEQSAAVMSLSDLLNSRP